MNDDKAIAYRRQSCIEVLALAKCFKMEVIVNILIDQKHFIPCSTSHRQCQNEMRLLPLQTRLLLMCKRGFSHLTRCLGFKKKVTVSALFCILKAFPLMIFTVGDIRQ